MRRIELDGAPVAIPERGRRLWWTSTSTDPRAQPIRAGDVLWVRRRAPGDRVLLPNGRTRKLQDVFTDARVPREARGGVMVLVDPDGLVRCVVGVWPRPGARPRLSEDTWLLDAPLLAERAAAGPSVGYKGLSKGR